MRRNIGPSRKWKGLNDFLSVCVPALTGKFELPGRLASFASISSDSFKNEKIDEIRVVDEWLTSGFLEQAKAFRSTDQKVSLEHFDD